MRDFFKNENIYGIVLCGGSGTRLWPLSRKKMPKQFLSLGGDKQSLLQKTLTRLDGICPTNKRWIVTADGQQAVTSDQCSHLIGRTIIEPQARNTAPAVALAAWELMKSDPKAIMLIVASDHVIQNIYKFEETIQSAVELAKKDYFVTVGIQPTYPATGFGYIEKGEIVGAGFEVKSFKEKPDSKTAEEFLLTGRYLWNASMFVWRAQTFWDAFKKIQPEMASLLQESDTPAKLEMNYVRMPNSPIDIAFMEKTKNIACVPSLFDWDDVGSWAAVKDCFEKDADGNNIVGDVFSKNTKNCVVHSSGPFVATVGVENLIVVATGDSVLVMPLNQAQEVKQVVNHLAKNNRGELL